MEQRADLRSALTSLRICSCACFLCVVQLDLSAMLVRATGQTSVQLLSLQLNSVRKHTSRSQAEAGRKWPREPTVTLQLNSFLLFNPRPRSVSLCPRQNQLVGELAPNMFAAPRGLMAPTLKQLDLSYNPHLSGPLPPAGATFTDLQEIVRTPTVTRAAVSGGRSCIFSFLGLWSLRR